GRDPANEVWLGASHISRTHLEIHVDGDGGVFAVDQSSNGTWLNGEKLPFGEKIALGPSVANVDFGGDVTFSIFFARDDLSRFESGVVQSEDTESHPPVSAIVSGQTANEHTHLTNDIYQAPNFGEESSEQGELSSDEDSLGVFAKMAQREDNRALESEQGDVTNEPFESVPSQGGHAPESHSRGLGELDPLGESAELDDTDYDRIMEGDYDSDLFNDSIMQRARNITSGLGLFFLLMFVLIIFLMMFDKRFLG
ncbi:hypothetical protein BVY02_02640, partial [bacterium J17]